jgi:hypothetical protein
MTSQINLWIQRNFHIGLSGEKLVLWSQGDQMNVELTFAVCFNLGYQFQANGLHSEALSTYSQIVKNKQVSLVIELSNVWFLFLNFVELT